MTPRTVQVGEAKPGETAPRRALAQREAGLDRPADSKANTLPEFIRECVSRHKTRKCMGWRDLIEIHEDTKQVSKFVDGVETKVDKVWQFYEYSPYKFATFTEVLDLVETYSRGLTQLGLTPHESKLHIFALTSPKWFQTFLASSFNAIPIVTAYDTLGEAGLTHSLTQTESNGIFTDNALLSNLIVPLQKAKTVKFIIHSEPIDPEYKVQGGKLYAAAKAAKEKLLKQDPELKFYSFEEVIALGKKAKDAKLAVATPEELACIMYTSGSTGDPKGVVISHANLLSAMGGVSAAAGRDLVQNTDRVVAFLPLAHIFEMAFELVCFWWGSCIGYANVKTLTDALCRNCKSDLQEFRPTVMVGVAAVFESVRKGVLAKVKLLPPLSQKLFWLSFKAKSSMMHYSIPGSSLFDVIFKKVKAATGGELKVILNGGSPISMDAQAFISTLIAPMLIGYGLTETCANTTISDHKHLEYGVVGTLTGAITCKLVDVADAGYFAKNNQGEIYLQGNCITKEYYKNAKETAEAFSEDGWFRTGDIGEWTANGDLKIIDRRKNLVKTLNGEYIALEKLESVYRSNEVVLNVCAFADPSKVKPIAVILPNEPALRTFVVEQNLYTKEQLTHKDLSHLVEDKKVVKAVHSALLATAKAQGLKGIELVQNIALLDEEWTPQNGFVTSAQKLQRKKILQAYQTNIDKAYSETP